MDNAWQGKNVSGIKGNNESHWERSDLANVFVTYTDAGLATDCCHRVSGTLEHSTAGPVTLLGSHLRLLDALIRGTAQMRVQR